MNKLQKAISPAGVYSPEWAVPPQLFHALPLPVTQEDLRLCTGIGTSIAQHGEIVQGQIVDDHRRRRRFLVSLHCPPLYSKATFKPVRDREITVEPFHKQKVKRVAELTLRKFDCVFVGGEITVESNIEEGKGYGSSTADCVAGALAAAEAVGQRLTEEEVAELVVEAEVASDNFMFKRAIIFAHREGVVLAELGPRMPRMEVLGMDTDVDGFVYTLEFPPAEYNWRQIECFHTMIAALRRAVRVGDLKLLGRVATASSVMNQQFLPKPLFSDIRRIAELEGALGISVAHSGTTIAVLLDPSDSGLKGKVDRIYRDLCTLGIKRVLRFQS